MATSIYFQVSAPSINLKREANREHDCRVVEILSEDGNILMLHFNGIEDVKAFVGLLTITVGDGNVKL